MVSHNLVSIMFVAISTYLFVIYHQCGVATAELTDATRYSRPNFPNREGRYHRANKAVDSYMNDIMSDDTLFGASKRQTSDDYGHLRFGKRGEQFDDYGHMRFGRNDK